MKILLDDLKELSFSLLNQAIMVSGGSINYYLDYYRAISLDNAYLLLSSTPVITMGSLIDDWESLELILKENSLSTTIDIERLGDITAFLGYELFRPEEEKKGLFFTVQAADILALYKHILAKLEDAGFEEFDITIDLYRKFSLKDAEDISQKKVPEIIIRSFVDDWRQLKQLDKNAQFSVADFERLGRTIKVLGPTIFASIKARTEAGINFLCSQFDGMDDEDEE